MSSSKLRQAAGYLAMSSFAASLLMAVMREQTMPARGAAVGAWPPARDADGVGEPPARSRSARFDAARRWVRSRAGVRSILISAWLAASIAGLALLVPDSVFFFHPVWLLHPFEQEHLTIAKHIAEHGSPFIRDPWFGQPGHGSEDMAYRDGAIVPRAGLAVYYIYAIPFLFSDTAWLWVTPFFGLVSALGVVALVARRTNRYVGLLAGVGFVFTAPVLVASSGLVFDNLIALTFGIWGVYALERLSGPRSLRWGIIAGLCFAGATLIRADYAPLGALAAAFAAVNYLVRRRSLRIDRDAIPAAMVALPFVAAVVAFVGTNKLLYGGTLETGYNATAAGGGQVWSGSAGGVMRSLLAFNAGDFLDMSRAFLFEIGAAQTLLMALGIAYFAVVRRLRAGDATLLGFCAFTLALDLGHSGTHGGAQAILVNSPPRYLLPVYTAGIIWGFEAMSGASRALTSGRVMASVLLVAGATLLVAGEGLREAYGTPYGFTEVRRTAERTRNVHEFAVQHPDDVFVGDIYTKALIGQRTIVPRRIANPDDLARYLRSDLAAGRRVFLVDGPSYTPTSPDYSGYYERLRADGFLMTRVSRDPEILELHVAGSGNWSLVVSVMTPTVGSELSGTARIDADADAIGGIRQVAFFVGDTLLGGRSEPPFAWSWDTRIVADGIHRVSVVAVGNSGEISYRDVYVSVINTGPGAPTVRVSYPRHNQTVSGTVDVLATAFDDDGLALVHFYIDGEYRASSLQAPFIWRWETTEMTNGQHSVWIKAIDRQGNSTVNYVMVGVNN